MSVSRSEQSRINGAKSRGPKTLEGKARSSLNAVKSGRYATNAVVLSNEDPDAFECLVAQYRQRIQPADTVEYNLVRELASIDWRLTRVLAIDSRVLDHELGIQRPAILSSGRSVAELTRLYQAEQAVVDRSRLPDFLARREGQLIRARQATLRILRDLRKGFPLPDPASEIVPPVPFDPETEATRLVQDQAVKPVDDNAAMPVQVTPGNANLPIGSGANEPETNPDASPDLAIVAEPVQPLLPTPVLLPTPSSDLAELLAPSPALALARLPAAPHDLPAPVAQLAASEINEPLPEAV